MDKYDIFVCYRGGSASSCELGARMYERIKRYNVFFAPECIPKGSNFKTIVPVVMNDVSVVVLLIDDNFFVNMTNCDDIVRYEIQCALENKNIVFLPIIIGQLNVNLDYFVELFGEEACERIKHVSSLQYNGVYHFSIENDLLPSIDDIYNGGNLIHLMKKRSGKRYHNADDQQEIDFLDLQQRLLFQFDNDVYEKILDGKTNLTILDVGCNDANQTMRRFGEDHRINIIMGIDRDEKSIQRACNKYLHGIFEVVDVDSLDFKMQMAKVMEKHKIKKFDLINISMIILHLEYPARVLQVLRSFLSDDGVVFIRDIDDGLNFTHPDRNSMFERLTEICKYCDMLGYRQSGRQIYKYLKNSDYSNISLEKSGLNTSTLSFDEKEALFNIYFGYIPIALKQTLERVPTLRAKHDYDWVNSIIDEAHDSFMKSTTLFQIGYMVYTASK